jgi:nucleotide-binding universal stress UspA family protein
MFQHILLPVDLSDRNLDAIETAGELAAVGGGRVTLVHVIETIEDSGPEEFAGFYRRLEEKAAARLAPWVERLAGHGVDARLHLLYGRRAARRSCASPATTAWTSSS